MVNPVIEISGNSYVVRLDLFAKAEEEARTKWTCGFCYLMFTNDELFTGDRVENEHGTPMHIGCYNEWCVANGKHSTSIIPKGAFSVDGKAQSGV